MEQGQDVLQDCPAGLQASVVSRREAVTQAWTTLDKVLDQQKRRLQRACMHHLFLSKVHHIVSKIAKPVVHWLFMFMT